MITDVYSGGNVSINGITTGTSLQAYHLLYDSANPPANVPPIANTTNVADITGGCVNDFLSTTILLDCLCVEDEISASYTPGGGDMLVYFLVNPSSGNILDSNSTGNFGNDEAMGDFFIFSLAYDSSDPPTSIPATGGNLSDFSNDGCFNSDFLGNAYYAQKINCALDVAASDPCICNNNQTANGAGNGTFSETITLEGEPSLQICAAASSSGVINPSIAIGSPFPETIVDASTSSYTISFEHTDAVGYTINFVDCGTGLPVTVTLENGSMVTSISNTCYYPVIDFQIDGTGVCANDLTPLDLMATLTNDNPGGLGTFGGNFSYMGTGVTGSQFDPMTAGPGTFTITATYTPNNAVGTFVDLANTVCTTVQTANITIGSLPNSSFTCPTTVDLCCDIADLAPTTSGGIWGGTAGTNVTANQLNPTGLSVGTHTLTYTVTDASGCTTQSDCTFTIIKSCKADSGNITITVTQN